MSVFGCGRVITTMVYNYTPIVYVFITADVETSITHNSSSRQTFLVPHGSMIRSRLNFDAKKMNPHVVRRVRSHAEIIVSAYCTHIKPPTSQSDAYLNLWVKSEGQLTPDEMIIFRR